MNAEKYYQSIRADRDSWKRIQKPRCMHCHKPFGWNPDYYHWPEVHEILSRAQAPNNWGFRANYLLLDHNCHIEVAALSHAEQLGIKLREDPEFYDLQEWLQRRNPNAMNYVTEDEVRRAS